MKVNGVRIASNVTLENVNPVKVMTMTILSVSASVLPVAFILPGRNTQMAPDVSAYLDSEGASTSSVKVQKLTNASSGIALRRSPQRLLGRG